MNFANGLPIWGTQIACRKNGEIIASVINLPKLNEVYYANKTGAYINGEKIAVKEAPIKSALYSIIGRHPYDDIAKMGAYSPNYRNFGAACVAFAFVASGKIQGSNFRHDTPWDYEPGLFLCQMAGAKTKSFNGFHAAAMTQDFLDILEKETVYNN